MAIRTLTVALLLCLPAGGMAGEKEKPPRDAKMTRGDSTRLYPRFSWDRIPLYMHVRKATSFTAKEIEFLARFPLITFEKANGHKDHGSVEAGTLAAARAVKKVNPDARVLYYRNVLVHYGGYEADKQLKGITGAFLKDSKGSVKLVRGRVPA
jgi:hypothetical protein